MKDLRKVAKELGELHDDNELLEMIERADFDQDGLVSEDEFYNLMTKKAYWINNDLIDNQIIYFTLSVLKNLFTLSSKYQLFNINILCSIIQSFNKYAKLQQILNNIHTKLLILNY